MSTPKLTAAVALCTMAVIQGAAWAQAAEQPASAPATPVSAPVPTTEESAKELADKYLRPNRGVVALVFDEKGEVTAVTREGRTLPACQICTTELERKYGPQCARARKLSDPKPSTEDKKAKDDRTAPICNKLVDTTIKGVNPISAIKHTGSQCVSFFLNSNGQAKVYQYCW